MNEELRTKHDALTPHDAPVDKSSRSMNVTIYRPNMRHELGLFRTWAVMARNVYGARELIWQLFKRDLLAGYKKSFIGLAWMFIAPIFGIISWVFLQRTGLLQPGDVGIPYPAYLLIGTSMWGLFMGFYGSAASTLSAGGGLLMQVNYPHEALLFKQLANHLANYTIGFAMNIVILLAFHVVPSWGIFLFPIVALPLFFLGAAFGLIISMVSVVAYDLTRFVEIGMSILMYSTPIIYSADINSTLIRTMNKWNPLTYLVCSCRDMIIYGRLYHPKAYFLAAGLSLLAFLISWRLFYVSEDKIIERMV
jgi:lipopolysaccharide transport system permease protein